MVDIVLVHGAFHGGWCWAETASNLTKRGARVFTPSLTGLADRKHLFSPSVNLATHVEDIVNLIEYESLEGCVLVGHSYAGNVLSGVGDQLREKISHYVFMDASVPVNGSVSWGWASLCPDRHPEMLNVIKGQGRGVMVPPFPPSAFGITEPDQSAKLEALLTPMPVGCYTDPIGLPNGGTEGLKRSYIAATKPAYERMAATIEWIKKDTDWSLREIATCHDMMLSQPGQTADIIWELIHDV